MTSQANHYDVLPYRSRTVEWTSPERLALAAILHGGPRVEVRKFRYLEVGCGDGSNILPLAFYRPDAQFIGIDNSQRAIEVATERARALELRNLRFVCADLGETAWRKNLECDFIVAHGVFSWISDASRADLLRLVSEHLAERGLVYINYNARPGWDIRGLVRDFLIRNTATETVLDLRCERARTLAAHAVQSFAALDDPYAQLMRREFNFVVAAEAWYLAHEYLEEHNTAFWESEFTAFVTPFGLRYVCEADFNYADRQPVVHHSSTAGSTSPLLLAGAADLEDLIHYRQLRCSVLARDSAQPLPVQDAELEGLVMAANFTPLPGSGSRTMLQHPSGFPIDASEPNTKTAFERLSQLWPSGVAIRDLFPAGDAPIENIKLLHHLGLVELRPLGPAPVTDEARLHQCQRSWNGYATSRDHTVLKQSDP